MEAPCVSIILPVYNEDGNIAACLRGLGRAMAGLDHEILVCYDFDEDKTLPAIAAMEDRPTTVKTVRNTLGRGVAFAIRAGFQAARGDVVVTTMADLSDPPEVIPLMARKIREEGADVVSGSRYMKGGSQSGGPPFKVLLSRAAGLSLRWIAGLGTHDATTNFRAYSRRFVDQVTVESRHGFELALELTVKAHARDFKVDEVPSTWKDRSAGESRFRLWSWLPRYLRWYLEAAAEPLVVWSVWLAATVAAFVLAGRHGPIVPYWPDEWMYVPVVTGREPLTLGWIFSFHNEHRVPLAKLIWILTERLSNFDGRWGATINVLFLSGAAGLLLLGIRAFRCRTSLADVVVPLVLLHGGHWENMAWPFQLAFALFVFVMAWVVGRILRLRRLPGDVADPGLAAGVFLLPFCGAATFPFVALLAPWTIWISRRDPRPARRRLSIALAAGALLLLPFYFGYARPDWVRSSPGLVADAATTGQLIAGSLGIARTMFWPASGWIAAAALATAGVVLLRNARTPSAAGLLLTLGALAGLSLVVGHSRSGTFRLAGFSDRYVTLFCLAPVFVYLSLLFLRRRWAARTGEIALLALLVFIYVPNAQTAADAASFRREASRLLLQDVQAGVPTALLAQRHSRYWSPTYEPLMARGLEVLASDRFSLYRTMPPPVPFAENSRVALPDGRTLIDLSAPFEIPLREAAREVKVDAGLLAGPSSQPVTITTRRLREGAPPEVLGIITLGSPGFQTTAYKLKPAPGARLQMTASASRPWAIVDVR